jgi:citrate lyase beta subunit
MSNPPTQYLSRSLLVTSALRMDRFLKGQSSDVDINLVDLEDAIPLTEKSRARREFTRLACDQVTGTLGLRINSVLSRDGLEDLLAVLDSPVEPDIVVIPKVEFAHEIELADSILETAGRTCRIWALLETPTGVANAMSIASCSRRLSALTFGMADYAAEIGASMGWESMLFARSQVVMAARSAGIIAVDAPTFDLTNLALLEAESRKSAEMGFSGKVVVHPRQIPVVNHVYGPTVENVKWARQVVHAFEDTSRGIHTVGDLMVGPPFLKKAQAILNLEERHEASLSV